MSKEQRVLSKVGIFGIISLLSYAASVFISPIAYPGYHWMSMAVSELSAVDAPSRALALQLNSLFGPCGIVSIMAVSVAISSCESKLLRVGTYLFATMEWICMVGYDMFPWVGNATGFHFQNMMHIIVTIAVVLLSISSMVLIAIGAGKGGMNSLRLWSIICLAAMLGGALGTNILPRSVFGIFERFSTFSAVIFNAILGYYLLTGRLMKQEVIDEK